MPRHEFRFDLNGPAATCDLARELADRMKGGDVILLSGDIGAGKTHFARCFIQASLDEIEDVPSPTYTLVQTYPGKRGEIWHADLYRLSDPDEIAELGLAEAFDHDICLVEWPDRLGDLAPDSALCLLFEIAEDSEIRHVTISWTDPNWSERLNGLFDG